MKNGMKLIFEERARQISAPQYNFLYEDGHTEGQIGMLAAAYALQSAPLEEKPYKGLRNAQGGILEFLELYWGNREDFFKPQTTIRDLVRAGALIAAEIDRLLREGEA